MFYTLKLKMYDWKQYLSSLYFNPKFPTGYLGSEKLYQIVKSQGIQISPRKKLFFRFHSANKKSQTRTFAEKTPRDFALVRADHFFSPQNFAEKLCENWRRDTANFHGVSPRNFAQILRENTESFKKKR